MVVGFFSLLFCIALNKHIPYFPWHNIPSTVISICMPRGAFLNDWATLRSCFLAKLRSIFFFLSPFWKKTTWCIACRKWPEREKERVWGRERERESSKRGLMEDGEETFGRPAGLLENCVQWWRGQRWESARSGAAGSLRKSHCVSQNCCKTQVFPVVLLTRQNIPTPNLERGTVLSFVSGPFHISATDTFWLGAEYCQLNLSVEAAADDPHLHISTFKGPVWHIHGAVWHEMKTRYRNVWKSNTQKTAALFQLPITSFLFT